MAQEFSAGAIIYYKNYKKRQIEYLLLHYTVSHWDYPKGHIEKGESYLDTVKRETEEETGLDNIRIASGFKENMRYFFQDKKSQPDPRNTKRKNKEKKWIFKMVTFFIARAYTKKITLSNEHQDHIWLPYNEALEKLTYKKAKNMLKKANDFIVAEKINIFS